MSCWWRIYCERNNLTLPATGGGSWKRIAAMHYTYNSPGIGGYGLPAGGCNWAKILRDVIQTAGSPGLDDTINGCHTKRLVEGNFTGSGSAARLLVLNGGRAPMD